MSVEHLPDPESRRRPLRPALTKRHQVPQPPPIWWDDRWAETERHLRQLEERLVALEAWRATPWADR